MQVIFKIIMAVITAFSGMGGATGFSVVEELFADSLSILVQRSDFLDEIGDDDVAVLDEDIGYVENTVLIFFAEDAGFFDKLDALGQTGGITVGSFPAMNLCVVRTAPSDFTKLNELCEKLMQHSAVGLASICPARKLEQQYTPDDPFTDYSWYTEYWNEESPYGNNWWLEATDARGAWGYDSLYGDIEIGVVDGGFDTEHDELEGKISFPSAKEKSRNRPNSHGTHVAGVIGAKADNGVGISGICQNSELICVDWTPSDGQVWIADLAVLFGFGKVVEAGAKVVNFSVGISSSISDSSKSFPSIVNSFDAFLYSYSMGSLLSKGYDFLVVQSAGNGNGAGYAVNASQNGLFCSFANSNVFLPFAGITKQDLLDRIIIVGSAALGEDGYIQSDSSNVGEVVDICAPGVMVYSCVQDNSYLSKSGTSMAAPMVTGVASLVWSVAPELTAPEVKRIVCENTKATVAPAQERYFDDVGYKTYPMVNAKLAVEAAILQRGNAFRVSLSGYSDEEVVFTDESGNVFVFETNEQGKLSCVLPAGTYSVVTQGVDTVVEINSDINI
ncbi:MAG: S8 family serine peptidase [Clostridia bacterium]|nr:S8 family serine peptidase [Clostridia bacterium]